MRSSIICSDPTCARNFSALVISLLLKRCQQHDPSITGEAVRNASRGGAKRESKFEKTLTQPPREGHASQRSKLDQSIDKHHYPVMFLLTERVEPVDDFVEQFQLHHDRIIALLR